MKVIENQLPLFRLDDVLYHPQFVHPEIAFGFFRAVTFDTIFFEETGHFFWQGRCLTIQGKCRQENAD